MPIPLYDHEQGRITAAVRSVQQRYWGKSNTLENLYNLESEIRQRLEQIGFESIVDVTPCFEEKPIEVRVTKRIDQKHDFDHELKKHEVIESRKKGGI
jgi:hypothetical protein